MGILKTDLKMQLCMKEKRIAYIRDHIIGTDKYDQKHMQELVNLIAECEDLRLQIQ